MAITNSTRDTSTKLVTFEDWDWEYLKVVDIWLPVTSLTWLSYLKMQVDQIPSASDYQ